MISGPDLSPPDSGCRVDVATIGLKYWSAETGLYYKYKYQTGSVVHLWCGGQAACDDDLLHLLSRECPSSVLNARSF